MAQTSDSFSRNIRNNEKTNPTKVSRPKKAIYILWGTFAFLMVAFTILTVVIKHGLVGYIPSLAELENPQSVVSSLIFHFVFSILPNLLHYRWQNHNILSRTD